MQTAPQVLDREFLEIRARILELAACFDRLDRAEGNVDQDPRLLRLRRALNVLGEAHTDRAEQVLQLFSREYDADWRQRFGV